MFMARDMGRGIIAPDNNDNIGTGASEMRTLGATTAAAINDVDLRATARIGTLETVTGAHSQELTEVMRRTSENRVDLERLETEGIEGLKGDPGEPGPGGAIALEETDPGCFVESDVTWMQWDTTVGTVVRAWNPNTETYQMIHGDTGWRELPLPERFISGRVLIKRENNDVTLRFEEVEITGLTDETTGDFLTDSGYLPTGFRPSNYQDRPTGTLVGSYTQYVSLLGISQQHRILYLNPIRFSVGTGNARASGEIHYTSTQSWPSSLPGLPA